MATHKKPLDEELRDILTGILTLQEWQEQLVRGALDKLDGRESPGDLVCPVSPKSKAGPTIDAP